MAILLFFLVIGVGGPAIHPILFPSGGPAAVLTTTLDAGGSDKGGLPVPGPISRAREVACSPVETAAGSTEMCLVSMGTVRICDREGKCVQEKAGPVLLDRTEVTVEQFARCVKAGACETRKFKTVDYSTFCNYGRADRKNHPMNCVEWAGAKQFCRFAGKRLPTRAEWLLGAGASDGRKYPWGDSPPDCSIAHFHSDKGRGCGGMFTLPVGSLPRGASPFGLLDMSGNVMEWTSSLAHTPPEGVTEEQLEAEDETMRFAMGGSFADTSEVLALTNSSLDEQESAHIGMGFRCAKTPDKAGQNHVSR